MGKHFGTEGFGGEMGVELAAVIRREDKHE